MVPVGSVLRVGKTLEAKKDLEVLWGDTVKTERTGRVRVDLTDGSVLNVGAESSLVVTKHDAATQETELDLAYGRVRATAVRITRPGGGFKVRTRSAVAGVVGTEEYLEATAISTTVIALGGGQVGVTSTDPRYPDPILLNPGEVATLVAGQRPGPKRLATAEELNKAVRETEADPVATLNPGTSIAGRTFDAKISGKGLSGATAVSFSQAGVQAQIRGQASATEIPVTITVGPDVPPGTYTLTVERPEGPARASLIVNTAEALQASESGGGGGMAPPASQSLSGIRGSKFALDASGTQAPSGTQIVSYQWRVLNTTLSSNDATFNVNTSLLPPGNYTIQLVVVNDRGQTATQQYPLVVDAGVQPAEIVRDIATAYESLQPNQFLRNFDDQKFRNYAGFAAAIEDSFRSQLETVRVFQRPVNCAVAEEQDQAVCQADFELQFTKKDQPTELLDPQGNPVPTGTTPPPGSTLGKRILTGSERTTLRFERGNAGWKIVDYASVVSCPGGAATTGVNVGSCVLALGAPTTPSFQIINLVAFSTDLPIGGSVSGRFEVLPVAGFTGSVNFTGQGQINDQSVTVEFSPNPSGPMGAVDFTVFAPTMAPTGLSGPQPFTLIITGVDTSGAVTVTANLTLVLQPDFSLTVTPNTTVSSPAAVKQANSLAVSVGVVPGAGFTGSVVIDFPNLPTGFTVVPSSANVAGGANGSFRLDVALSVPVGPAFITIRGTNAAGLVKTVPLFLDVQPGPTAKLPDSQRATQQTSTTTAARTTVTAVNPAMIPAGVSLEGTIYGTNLDGATSVSATGAGLHFEVLEAQPTELRVRITADAGAAVGTRLLTVQRGAQRATAALRVTAPLKSKVSARPDGPPRGKDGEGIREDVASTEEHKVAATQLADLSVRAEDISMSPANPKPGDTVTFRVRVTNQGTQAVESATVEFAIDGTRVREREQISLEPGASQTFVFEWAAAGNGRLAPRVAIDPDSQLRESSRANNAASLPSFELAAAAGTGAVARPSARVERAQIRLTPGGCAAFRFASGTEQPCGENADIEFHAAASGDALTMEAEGIRNAGVGSLDQMAAAPEGALATSAPLERGAAYVVQARRGTVILRVIQVRRTGAGRGVPAPLRGPRAAGVDRESVAGESGPSILLTLEWKDAATGSVNVKVVP